MDHKPTKNYHLPNRFGFHYYPDSTHYTEKDIQLWLPVVKGIKAQWLVIQTPMTRAVPEDFIRKFSESGINLVIDFNAPFTDQPDWHDIELLMALYGKWGVKYALLNKHPNLKKAWKKSQWGDSQLIDLVISDFIRFASICLENSIRPIFPLLTPGGDYWDLAFLQTALQKLKNDASLAIQNNFILSAAAWDWNRSLDWGAGGQTSWPKVRPYQIPQESQNQLGFRTFEWYANIAREVFGKSIPVLLLQVGISNNPEDSDIPVQSSGLEKLLKIFHLINGENVYETMDESRLLAPISSDVIGCCFYLLSSDHPAHKTVQWFSVDGVRQPPAQAIFIGEQQGNENKVIQESIETQPKPKFRHNRYILLANELQSEKHALLELLHPYIEKYRPIIGFSIAEAKKSAMILAIAPSFGPEPLDFEQIRNDGSLVNVIRSRDIPAYLKEYDNVCL